MKLCIILGLLSATADVIIRSRLNEKGRMVAHPFARVQMIIQSLLYKIYS